MRHSERLYRQKYGSTRKPGTLLFEKLEERRLLAGDFIQQVTEAVSVEDRDSYLRTHLDLGQHETMQLIDVQEDRIGFTHYEYQQMYKGVPVLGGVYSVHAKAGELVTVSGRYVPIADNFIGPTVHSNRAFNAALDHVDADLYIWNDSVLADFEGITLSEVRRGELVYYTPENGEPTLSYRFDVYALEPFTRDYVFVDARTGSDIVASMSRFSHADTPATGIATYDGLVDITVDKTGILPYFSFEARRNIRTLDVGNGTNTGAATVFLSLDNTFDEPQHDDGVQVHYGVENFYDYFYFVHGLDSYDGANSEFRSFVNYDVGYADALWTGTSVRFGDGDGITTGPWVSQDIVGHEYTHGVSEVAVGSIPTSWQFDALNESFGDIFGTAVERYARGGQNWNWTIGEQIQLSGTGALRSLADPTLYGGGIDNFAGLDMLNTPHQNAGVQNKWFYRLANGIGFDEAAAIAFRNLTVYLVSDSTYTDARLGSVQSAIDLYGINSFEHLVTQATWDAVGVVEYDPQDSLLTNFEPVRPAGSQIYTTTVNGTITVTDPLPLPPPAFPPNLKPSGYQDTYYVELDGNQTISALVQQTSGDLEPNVRIVSPGGGIIADIAGGQALPLAATRSVEVSDPGTYTIIVSGTDNEIIGDDTGQFGGYELQVYLNADIELESYTGVSNDQAADAQQLDILPIQIGSSDAEHVSVVGSIVPGDTNPGGGGGGTVYAMEDFESGVFPPLPPNDGTWTEYESNPFGRRQVTNAFGAANNSKYALWMDVEVDLIFALNEVVWSLDSSAFSATPYLNVSYAEYGDEADILPSAWVNHREGDGVSISVDEMNWFLLDDPFPTSSDDGVWENISYDLAAVATANGITLSDHNELHVKFQQFDNYMIDIGGIEESDGRGWDDISITEFPLYGNNPPVGDWYEFELQPGEAVEFVATNTGIYVPNSLQLDLYDFTGTNLIPTVQTFASDGLSNVDVQTSRYTHAGTEAETYFINVTAADPIEYSLIATFDSLFDTEATIGPVHDLNDLSGAIGYLTSGQTEFVEPDDFAPGDSLQNVFPDAILSNTSGGGVYASHDIVNGPPDFLVAPSGFQVFTPDASGAGPWNTLSYGWNEQNEALRVDFLTPQQQVFIQFNSDEIGVQESAILYAYRADGSLIGQASGISTDIFDVQDLVFISPAADIAYIIAGGFSGDRVILDNLQYTSEVDVDVYQIDAVAGDVVQWAGYVPANGAGEFQNNLSGVILELFWRDPNNGDALVFVAGGTSHLIQDIVTLDGEYELHVTATGGQGEYYLTDVLEESEKPVLAHACTDTILIGSLGDGVAVDINPLNEVDGYLMYSVENVHARFPAAIQVGSADHIVAVHYVESFDQWQFSSLDGVNWLDFTPARGDLLIANVDFDADVVLQDLKGQDFVVGGWKNGIRGGYLDGDLLFKENFYNNMVSPGDYTVRGSYIIAKYESTRRVDIPPINEGVLTGFGNNGSGYLMYTYERAQDRFPGLVNPNNADHVIGVRIFGGQWQFKNIDSGGWVNFTPDDDDVLIADVNFTADTVTGLRGLDTTINGIKAGYASGDIRFHPNRFISVDVDPNDPSVQAFSDGIFNIRGSYFDVHVPLPTELIDKNTTTTNFGIAADDAATGMGYLMYTDQSVHSTQPSNRFAGNVNTNNAEHLIAVRLFGDQWQYTNKDSEPWRNFVPRTSDVLLAEIDFTNDTITSLEGTEFRIEGVAAGYISGTFDYVANQWNSVPDLGEFDVISDNGFNYDFVKTEPQHEILGEIVVQDTGPTIEPGNHPIAPMNLGVAAADSAVGTGYIMYSSEIVHDRFRSVDPDNADHFVAVRLHDYQWEYTNDDELGWLRFTPQAGDILVAEVDYGLDLITMLEGTYEVVGGGLEGMGGIVAGYIGGNLEIQANRWNDTLTRGEYYLTGNYISTHCPPDVQRFDAIGYRGFTGDDSGIDGTDPSQSPSLTRVDEINRPEFGKRIADAKADFDSPSFKHGDVLTNRRVFGSAISQNGRSLIGEYAVPEVDSSLVGSVIFNENVRVRDTSFALDQAHQSEDLKADLLNELVADIFVG